MSSNVAEIMDQETGEVTARPTALARVTAPIGGARVLALESMEDAEFDSRLALLKRGQERMRRVQRELLDVEAGDYGEIPGTGRGKEGEPGYKPGKPTLLKPGAEKLLKFYGLVATFVIERVVGDSVTAPAIHVSARCRIHVGDADGPVIAEGDGTCSTWERKYRYRDGRRACPSCGATCLLRTKRNTPKEQWWCPPDKGGCNANFPKDDAEILSQIVGLVENPDQHDLDNTVVKMAVKRALVAATLIATATSGLFTQDLEDQEPSEAQVQRAREGHEKAAQATEDAIRPLIGRLKDIVDLAAFDAELLAIAPLTEALPEPARVQLRKRCANMRDALKAMVAQDSAAREHMSREPDPPAGPAADAAERSALRASLSAREPGDDIEPPSDEEQAAALVEPCLMARSTVTLAKLWERVKATQSFTAATAEAKALAEQKIAAKRASLMEEGRKAGGAA